jgi:hypothetical protein
MLKHLLIVAKKKTIFYEGRLQKELRSNLFLIIYTNVSRWSVSQKAPTPMAVRL